MNSRIGRNNRPENPFASVLNFFRRSPRTRRIVSAVLDMAITGGVVTLGFRAVTALMGMDYTEWFAAHVREHHVPPAAVTAVMLVLFVLKDVLPVSPGKAITGLRITENGGKAPVWKRILRNVTILVWPAEAVAVLVSGRRLCDRMLGLEVTASA